MHGLAWDQAQLLLVRSDNFGGTPLSHGNHWTAGCQCDARRSGLAGHRPQAGILGDRSLGVDHHALPCIDSGDRITHCSHGLARFPVNGDLACAADDRSRDRNPEHRFLGKETGRTIVVPQNVRDDERIEPGDVVDSDDDAAVVGVEVLRSLPVAFGERHHEGPEQENRDAIPRTQTPPATHPGNSPARLTWHPRRLMGVPP